MGYVRGRDMERFVGIILAAGEGIRMKSRIPKVLHCLGGKELIRYPVELLGKVGVERIIVVISPTNQEAVKSLLGDSVEYAVQTSKTGTAGAVESAVSLVGDQAKQVVVLDLYSSGCLWLVWHLAGYSWVVSPIVWAL